MFGRGMMDPGAWGAAGARGGRVILEGGHWGHHFGGFGVAGMVLGLVLWAAVMIALILGIMTLIRNWRHPRFMPVAQGPSGAGPQPAPGSVSPDALRILEDRYARGEVNHDEYLERRKDLTGSGS